MPRMLHRIFFKSYSGALSCMYVRMVDVCPRCTLQARCDTGTGRMVPYDRIVLRATVRATDDKHGTQHKETFNKRRV